MTRGGRSCEVRSKAEHEESARQSRDLPQSENFFYMGGANVRSEQAPEQLAGGNTPRIAEKKYELLFMYGMSKEHELVNKNGVVWC